MVVEAVRSRFGRHPRSPQNHANGLRRFVEKCPHFCLWMAAAKLDNYCDAMRTTALVGGDIDTTCAIVGSVVALGVGQRGIPESGDNIASR